MKQPTNQEVYDALTSGITKRWNRHAESPDGYSSQAEDCALCKLFDDYCTGCPLVLETGKVCSVADAPYERWHYAGSAQQRRAKEMLALLEKIRNKYFGDWK